MQRRTFLQTTAATISLALGGSQVDASDVQLQRTYEAPELEGIARFLGSEAIALRDLRGKVIALHFWTFSCSNCIANLPHYNAWHRDYAKKGLVVLGVHTPEFDHEAKIDNVAAKLRELEIDYPVAIDNEFKTWKAWRNRFWPTVHLIDHKQQVRASWVGELNWKENKGEALMRSRIETLLANIGQ